MSTTAHKVLIADDSLRPDGVRMLEQVAAVTMLPPWPSEKELIHAARGVDAILSRSAIISSPVIATSPKLKIVSRHGVGLDYVDVEACTEHGVLVTTTGDANSQAVSEQAFALMLAVARRVSVANAGVKAGKWGSIRPLLVGTQLHQKVLGIVGLGRIGSRVARQAKGFAMEVIACDPYIDPDRAHELDVALVDLETLLRRSDVVTMHVPLTDETRGMIGRAELELTKSSVILINTARGPVVDEEALIEALTTRRIAGAGIDVFAQEPLPAEHPLLQLDDLVCSPHIAGQTEEAMVGMSVQAAENILCVLRGEVPPFVANPEVIDRTSRVKFVARR
jgi:D-3-phosphoglycerate dehydrogenase